MGVGERHLLIASCLLPHSTALAEYPHPRILIIVASPQLARETESVEDGITGLRLKTTELTQLGVSYCASYTSAFSGDHFSASRFTRGKMSKWNTARVHDKWHDNDSSSLQAELRRVYMNVNTLADLSEPLRAATHSRVSGRHPSQPVLLCAGPGAGKTWSMVQLAYDLAMRCGEAASAGGVPLVPVVIYVQRLARMLQERAEDDVIDSSILLQYFAREV